MRVQQAHVAQLKGGNQAGRLGGDLADAHWHAKGLAGALLQAGAKRVDSRHNPAVKHAQAQRQQQPRKRQQPQQPAQGYGNPAQAPGRHSG